MAQCCVKSSWQGYQEWFDSSPNFGTIDPTRWRMWWHFWQGHDDLDSGQFWKCNFTTHCKLEISSAPCTGIKFSCTAKNVLSCTLHTSSVKYKYKCKITMQKTIQNYQNKFVGWSRVLHASLSKIQKQIQICTKLRYKYKCKIQMQIRMQRKILFRKKCTQMHAASSVPASTFPPRHL